MHLPLQSIAFVNSLTHEGKVVIFATTESKSKDTSTFGKIYYTIRQDGFEDNVDRTAMVGWKYWTLLPFIDESEDLSVRELEGKDNDLIRSHYRAAGSLGAVAQVQVVSHREAIYVFRIHRKSNRVLVDRFILNGLTNELMPKLEVRYKRSRQKHKANAKMKIVNGRLEGLDSLDFRDANDLPFSEPTKEFQFMEVADHSQFAVCVVPTTDKDIDRWHFFLPSAKSGAGIVRAISVRSDRHGEFLLDDQLVIDPAEDENAETVVRSIPSVVEQQFKLTERLGRGIAATNFHIQTEQATKGGPQLIKGAARLLLAFNTSQGRLGALSFGLSTDGLLSYLNPQADEQKELRPSKRRSVFLPVRHMEEVVALGRAEPLPNGKVSAVSRGELDKTVVHTEEVHGLEAEDQVELNGQQNFNGKYVVRKLSENKFSLIQNWESPELGDWQLLPKDPEKGLAFEGLITHIEQVGEEIHFSTALDHGLEDELDVLIKHHQALAGQFEVSPIDEHSFAIATDWPPVQVINLFAEAAKRKGLVFDGVQDAVMVEDVLLDLPREDKDFGHTFSCWVKPNRNTINEEQLLLAEGSGTVRISLRAGHIQAVVRLPSGMYSIKNPDRLPADSWSNIALVVERKAAYEPIELRLYRNADLVPAETEWTENPIMAFPNFTDKGLHFGGNSFAQFVYTHNYPPPGRDFTFECWLKPDTVSGHQPIWHTIMPIRIGPFGNIEIETFHAISLLHGGRLRAQLTLMDQNGRPTLAQAESEADLNRDQWAHVAVVGKFTPQGNSLQFVINGQAELPKSIDDGLPLWQQSIQILGRSTPQSGPFADRIRNFKGAIGQLRIWSSALEAHRIIRLAKVSVTEGNPSPGGGFIPLNDRMPTALTFDLHEWMVFSGNMNDEGGGYPAPGEVLHFGDVSTSGSPIKKLPKTDKSAQETYRSYLLPNWSGRFHFGGLAPAKALKLGAKASYSCAPDRGMTLQTGQDSFTFECLVKTNQNGGVIWSMEDRDSDQFQFVGLDNGELGWSNGNDGSFEKMAVPQLFDDQWHLLSMRYDRSYAQSEDAWVHVYVDGESIGFGLASPQQLADRSPIRMGGLANPNDPMDRQLELAHVRFWTYQRSDDQIKAAQHQLPTGEELGLAAYWPLDNEELIDLGPDKLNLSAPYPAHFTDYPNPSFASKGGLKGILAEVRIWNTALSKEYLRKSLFTPLVGREYRLAGNWRMGAIWEEEQKVSDFSTQGNDGQVFGDVYVSPDSLRRRLGPTETAPLTTSYRNEELVAVSARAIYEETLEFRLIGQDGKPVRNKRLAEKAFHFHFRGKKGRSSKKWIGHERFVPGIISEHIGESIHPNAGQGDKDYGWYRAICRFVVPDKVALLRVLGLHKVDGDWQRMEIRRHRLTHISEAISHVVHQNALDDLSTIGEAPVDTRKSRGLIRFFQNQIVSYRERLALLEDWIKKAENDSFNFQQEIDRAKEAVNDAEKEREKLRRDWTNLHKNRDILLTYKYRIKAKHSNKYLTLPYDLNRGSLNRVTKVTQNNAHGRIADFNIEQADHDQQFYLRVASSKNHYLGGIINTPILSMQAKGSQLFAQIGKNALEVNLGFRGQMKIKYSTTKFQFFYGHSWANNLSSLETVKAAGTKAYRINVEGAGLAVDITGSEKNNGAKCIQWTYNSPPSDNQFFHIEIQEGSSISPEVQSMQRAKAEAEQAFTIALNKYNTLKNQPRDKSNLESWITERNDLVAKIADAYIQISSSEENYKSAITELKALALPPLSSNDPNELITKGAYLGFVEAKDQLFLYENCEGEVQLCYGDRFGRIRQTKYDVTADSRNPYFEEWVPDGPKLALKLGRDNSLIPNTKFQLGSEFTVEWWVNCQATHWEGDGNNGGGLLDLLKTEDGTALPTLANRALGFEILSQKEKSEWNQLFFSFRRSDGKGEVYPLGHLGDLSEGWHHIGFVKKGTGPDVVAELYVDGELRFNSRQFIGSLFEEMPREQRDDFRKRFKEYYTFLDGAGQQDIVELGSTFVQGSQFELAELRIWTLALDAEEISANSKVELSGNELGLLGYYKMNEGVEGTNIEIRNYAHGNAAYNLTLKGDAKWVPFDPTIGGLNRKVTYFPNPRTIGHWLAPKATMYLHTAEQAEVYQLGRISFWTKLDQRMGHSRLISISNGSNSLEFALVIGSNGEVSLNSSSRGQGIPMSVPFYFGSWVQVTLNQANRSHLEIYFDGKLVGTSFALRLPQVEGISQAAEADKLRIEFGWQRGEMAQFAIYDRPADQAWIEANYRANIDPASSQTGTAAGLVAYFPMDQEPNEENQLVNLVDADRPLQFQDNYQPSLHRTIDLPIATMNTVSNEYHTVTIDPQSGEKRAMLRRFFAMPDQNGLQLYANKRIEELELLWVGNAQFKPTLLGYIEGAPPVPSENLTKASKLESYGGATSVALHTREDTVYNWNRSQDASTGFNLDVFLGGGGDIALNAPFIGRIKVGKFEAGFKGSLNFAYHFLNQTSISSASSNITTDKLSLSGGAEEKAKFPDLGKRFVPKNVGYALVISGLADVYVLRLRRSKKMVAYQVQANEDLPMDINTITFLINPAYIMNGSLDGLTGTQATSERYFRQVPQMRAQYGSLYPASYFRLHEAYDLKKQIEQEDKRRAAYFDNFNSRLVDETSLDRNIDNSEFDPGAISVNDPGSQPTTDAEGNPISQQDQMDAGNADRERMQEQADEQADLLEGATEKRQQEIESSIENQDQKANASYQLARWQKKMEDLQIRAGKRNIVNTYVWDADGGLRAESQQFSNTVQHTIGGSVNMNAAMGVKSKIAIGFMGELNFLATVGLTQTLTKTGTNSKGFTLDVDVSGVEKTGVTDHDDNPLMPGEKVGRYRFMSYYLEGTTKHFHDFFNRVVDPEWLQSNSEEARALRQTLAGKANATWRVLHRVTYVERPALKGFGKE